MSTIKYFRHNQNHNYKTYQKLKDICIKCKDNKEGYCTKNNKFAANCINDCGKLQEKLIECKKELKEKKKRTAHLSYTPYSVSKRSLKNKKKNKKKI